MRRIKPSPIRNKINFSNANEFRVLKKRLASRLTTYGAL
jgi:hypothetical protein